MKRRYKASRSRAKAPARGAAKLKHRTPSKGGTISTLRTSSPPSSEETEVTRLSRELGEAAEQQTAMAEILQIISSSPGELERVFESLLQRATSVCHASFGNLVLSEGDGFRVVSIHNAVPAVDTLFRGRLLHPHPQSPLSLAAKNKRVLHIDDLRKTLPYREGNKAITMLADVGGARTFLCVPLLKKSEVAGVIVLYRNEVRPFTGRQIALVENFAAQAVIAIENTRLLSELRQRTSELEISLEYQTATSDVLKVISGSVFDLRKILEFVAETAARLCAANQVSIFLLEGDVYRFTVGFGLTPAYREIEERSALRPGRETLIGRVALAGEPVHVHDVLSDPQYGPKDNIRMADVRSILGVPLNREGKVVGVIALARELVSSFSGEQIELVRTFADQAVIAIENARLLRELRERTDDLSESLHQQTATSDVLKVISRSAFDLQGVFDTLISSAVELSGAFNGTICLRDGDGYRYLATAGIQGEFRKYLSEHPPTPGRASAAGRVLLSGEVVSVPDVLEDPDYIVPAFDLNKTRSILGVPLLRQDKVEGALVLARNEPGLFTRRHIDLVQSFADQAVIAIENARLFDEVQARTKELSLSLEELRTAQDRLIQTEKLASLGQLTAGIAHEIKNPLNFVNNFSGVSVELIDELQQTLPRVKADANTLAEIAELTDTLRDNLNKIVQHGKRADSIVKNMLLHSREGSGEHRPVDINALVEECLNLAYHGARAEKQGFNITLHRSFDPDAGEADVFPQEITRVLLNVISNGFYAATKRKAEFSGDGFEPTLVAGTKSVGDRVEIRIRDNGVGIPPDVKDKIFNPFFTTKPAGEGTGLGLSISHDIIVKQHSGSIEAYTQPGEFTEVRIVLPRAAAFIARGL